MQGRMSALQAELASKRFEASAGGGMVTAVASGDLRIVEIRIARRFPLADAAEAHRVLESRAVTGSMVLKP